MTTTSTIPTAVGSAAPTDRILTVSLLFAPLVSLAADATYAANGWEDATAGVVHVLGAIAYAFVVLRVVTWLGTDSRLVAAILVTGMIGLAGNVAYGFEAIHTSFGDVALVDRTGAANLIKPLGLFFPLSFLLVGIALDRLGRRVQAVLVVVAMLAWPVAHIANIAPLAVVSNVVLVIAFGSLAWARPVAREARR